MDTSFLMKCLRFPILVFKLECDSEIEKGVSPSQQHSFSFIFVLAGQDDEIALVFCWGCSS